MRSYLQDLKSEFSGYDKTRFFKDIMAGITVAAVAIPLALAFGVSSGATAASGLLTAVVAGFVIGMLGGAYYQISGPTGAMAAILMSITAQYGMSGIFVATVMAGIFLILAGALHLGRVIAYIPMPVITGFTSGIAVIIALGQLDNFFGVSSSGTTTLSKIISYFTNGFSPDISTTILSLLTVAIMVFYPKKLSKIAPSSLVAIILITIISVILPLDVARVGAIPSTIFLDERLSLDNFTLSNIQGLIMPAVSIAVLGMVESLLCGASAGRMVGGRLKCDRELVAQGIGNILVPFFGGIPATAAIARTSVAIKSGATTRLAGMIHALVLLISMFSLGAVMSKIPLCTLAGVLVVTAWRMNEWRTIKYIFYKRFKGAMAKFLVTMLATIVFDLTIAILIGVTLSLVLLVAELSHIRIKFDFIDADKLTYLNKPLPAKYEKVEVIYIMGAVIFANTDSILELQSRVDDKVPVIFSMRGTSYMDISGAGAFLELINTIKSKNIPVFIAGVSDDVKAMMTKSGVTQAVGEDNFYWSVEMILG